MGAAGVHYGLVGGSMSNAAGQFEVLAGIPGNQLASLPPGAVSDSISAIPDSASRWCKVLREFSGAFEIGSVGIQTSAPAEDMGCIYTCTLKTPV